MASQPFSAPCNEKSLEGFDKENRDIRSATEYVSDVAVFHEPLPVGPARPPQHKACVL
jgi:hypothetical protein